MRAKFLIKILYTAAIVFIFSLGSVLAIPKFFGGQSYSVLSGSMSPVVNTGDMVTVIPIKGKDMKTGDIVAFSDPEGTGKLFQHRVQSLKRTGVNGTTISVVTKGDANTATEKWMTTQNAKVGKVILVVPKAGFIFGNLTGGKPVSILNKEIPLGMAIILGLVIIVSIIVLIGIFREPNEPTKQEEVQTENLRDLLNKKFQEVEQ